MEISALWAVFPLLDTLLQNKPFDVWLLIVSGGISLTTLLAGIILRKDEPR